MIAVIICTALLGMPVDAEVCYMGQRTITSETFCETAAAFAAVRRHPLRVTYCRDAVELDHPAEVLVKLNASAVEMAALDPTRSRP